MARRCMAYSPMFPRQDRDTTSKQTISCFWGIHLTGLNVRWITLVLARTIRGPWASSRPGSAPMRPGLLGVAAMARWLRLRGLRPRCAGGWAMDASGAPGAAAVVR